MNYYYADSSEQGYNVHSDYGIYNYSGPLTLLGAMDAVTYLTGLGRSNVAVTAIPLTTHALFNQLHKRLIGERSPWATIVDAIHHDYTEG